MADKVKQPLESLDECVAWVLSGCKAPRDFKIGTEYERFAIDKYGQPLPYDGAVSIRTLFDRLIARHGWQPLLENGHPIALLRNGASVSLEPAGQFELSGGAFATVAEMQAELTQHLAEVRDVAEDLGVTLAHVGYNPLMNVAQVPKMPKGRYAIMRKLMPQVGQNGLDMMHLTCTVQTNLDFSSEFECMQMHRLGHLLSPVLIALFANSPLRQGVESGYATFRAHLWIDVDNARCDVRRFAFDQHASVADYVQWVADVPMYFVDKPNADGSHGYQDLFAEPMSFRQYFERGYHGRRPTIDDWELHASTVFPDIRLKRYLEIRQCDIVPPAVLPALAALTKGLFYDETSRLAALAVLRDGDATIDRTVLRDAACMHALDARVGDVNVREWAKEILILANAGLQRLAVRNGNDAQAAQALEPLKAIVAGDQPPLYQIVRERIGKNPSLLALADGW